MARPVDPNAQYRLKPHKTKGYIYASTQPSHIDPQTGKKKYRHVHWGSLENGKKFIPGTAFYTATPDERERLIFPEEWDTTEATKLMSMRSFETPVHTGENNNRLYGDIWLLEQVALRIGIRQDLEAVFSGNREIVDDIITLAVFPYLTKYTYNRVARWQKVAGAPSTRELAPPEITRLTQSVTERHRMELLKLRAARVEEGELCAVDSTTRSAYGESLADIRWGKNKEGLPLPQTTEVVVYSLSSHMPVYYRTFPGNMPDSRGMDTIFADLAAAGFGGAVFVTDRGYETIRNLEKHILRGHSVVMCAKTGQKKVMDTIRKLGEFGTRPTGMHIDPEAKIYHIQHELDYVAKGAGKATRLKLNLYFDPVRRSLELLEMDICLSLQLESLREKLVNNAILSDDRTVKRDYSYYNIICDPVTREIETFSLNEQKVAKARRTSGFFSIITHGVGYSAMEAYKVYGLRDEQEKCFQQMKDQMVSDRQRNWSEEGKTGRLFILFVSLIISSYVRHIWGSTRLRDLFSSSLEMLDEMRPIRLVEHTGHPRTITPFVGTQVDICDVFGFDIPEGCRSEYASPRKPKRKRGRPPKTLSQ